MKQTATLVYGTKFLENQETSELERLLTEKRIRQLAIPYRIGSISQRDRTLSNDSLMAIVFPTYSGLDQGEK